MHLVDDLLCVASEISFELAVHIILYEDQNSIMIMHSMQYSLSSCLIYPFNIENIVLSKW